MARINGIDFNKGIAILGMLFFHAFQTGIAHNNSELTINWAFSLPPFVTYGIILPLVFISHLGSLFVFLTVMTTTISLLSLYKKNKKAIISYLFGRLIFAVALKALELFWYSFLINYDFLSKREFAFPSFEIPYDSGTLDAIGILGFLVPTLVYGLISIPHIHYSFQILIIMCFIICWWPFYQIIGDNCNVLSNWLSTHGFNILGLFFSKCGTGSFQISEMLPFGLLGACWGILMFNTKSWKYYAIFCSVVVSICVVIGTILIFFTPEFIQKIGDDRKPLGYLLVIMAFQNIMHLTHCYFTDGPRTDEKLLKSRRHTTYLRRLSCVSLTAFVIDTYTELQVLKVFEAIFGPAADYKSNAVLWNSWLVLIYMFTYALCWMLLIRLWEKISFRWSLEHQLSSIIQWIYNKPYNKMDFKKVIYEPIWEIERKSQPNEDTTIIISQNNDEYESIAEIPKNTQIDH
ncbi:hypothetical protein WA158_000912 [Blastocystis sp. Blastoise]